MHNYSNLENRLILFSTRIIKIFSEVTSNYALQHLSKQLIRSSTSVCLNYGEAQCAESQRDFIHKMRICLKELKESSVALRIIVKLESVPKSKIEYLLEENDQFIAIFYKSIQTASKKK